MRYFSCMRRILLAAAFAAAAALAFAHPHMSLTSKLEFEFAGGQCRGFWVEWAFDPYFSASIIQEHDADRNGSFSAAESAQVQQFAFSNLRKYGYFVFLRKGDVRTNPAGVERFTALRRGDILVYRFFINLEGKGFGDDFHVAVFDATYFCAVEYAPTPVVVSAEGGAAPKWERSVNKKYPVYYNPAGAATDGTIYQKWKPGLETAYPEEIHVYP